MQELRKWTTAARLWIAILSLATQFLTPASALAADEKDDETDENTKVESPSPDGRYAFLSKWSEEAKTLDLVEKKSRKILIRAAESDEGGNRLSTDVLWAPNSQRVALMVSTSRRSAGIAIFERKGDTFVEVEIKDLPTADIPEKYENDKRLWHVVESDWATPVRWQKNGSLVVTVTTTVDGNDNFVTAERTVTLAIKDGKATVTSSKLTVKKKLE